MVLHVLTARILENIDIRFRNFIIYVLQACLDECINMCNKYDIWSLHNELHTGDKSDVKLQSVIASFTICMKSKLQKKWIAVGVSSDIITLVYFRRDIDYILILKK